MPLLTPKSINGYWKTVKENGQNARGEGGGFHATETGMSFTSLLAQEHPLPCPIIKSILLYKFSKIPCYVGLTFLLLKDI